MPAKKTIFMGTTTVEAVKTVGEISAALVRAGARDVSTQFEQGKIVAMRFSVVVAHGPLVWFKLPCRTEKLLSKLRGDRAQAERVAWRQVLRWVEAQLAMAESGLVYVHEVFMPYMERIDPESGNAVTMFEAWQASTVKALGAGK